MIMMVVKWRCLLSVCYTCGPWIINVGQPTEERLWVEKSPSLCPQNKTENIQKPCFTSAVTYLKVKYYLRIMTYSKYKQVEKRSWKKKWKVKILNMWADRESQRGCRWIPVLSWVTLQMVWGQSFRGALVVFQPINPLHIFNPVRWAAGEEHWRMHGH